MPTEQDMLECEKCGKHTMHFCKRPNHILHLILSLLTFSGWLIVWFLLCAFKQKAKCAVCGEEKRLWGVALGILAFIGILITIAIVVGSESPPLDAEMAEHKDVALMLVIIAGAAGAIKLSRSLVLGGLIILVLGGVVLLARGEIETGGFISLLILVAIPLIFWWLIKWLLRKLLGAKAPSDQPLPPKKEVALNLKKPADEKAASKSNGDSVG